MHTIYTGTKVRLRPFADVAEYQAVNREATTMPNDHWKPWYTAPSECKSMFEPAGLLDPAKYSLFAVERLDTGACIGWEEFGEIAPGAIHTWLGTEILRDHWHQGFGIEAKQLLLCFLFENFPFELVHADTCEPHTRAQQGLLACGMKYLGRLHGTHFKDGQYWDVLHYEIFREEWEQLPIRQYVKRG